MTCPRVVDVIRYVYRVCVGMHLLYAQGETSNE
jgi:hypothetical protein